MIYPCAGENVVQVGSNLKVLRVTEEDLGSYACYQGGNFIQGYDVDISFRYRNLANAMPGRT